MIPRLKEQYDKVTVDNLQKKFSMKSKFMVPKFLKVVLNMGFTVWGEHFSFFWKTTNVLMLRMVDILYCIE